MVSHAGMGLLRQLADQTGLTTQVTAVLADTDKAGNRPGGRRPRYLGPTDRLHRRPPGCPWEINPFRYRVLLVAAASPAVPANYGCASTPPGARKTHRPSKARLPKRHGRTKQTRAQNDCRSAFSTAQHRRTRPARKIDPGPGHHQPVASPICRPSSGVIVRI